MVSIYCMLAIGRRQIVEFAMFGDFFGWNGLPTLPYSTLAVTEVTAVCYSRRCFESQLDQNPALGKRLFAVFSDKLGEAQERMLLLGQMTAQEKVASFLLKMAERIGRREGRYECVRLPMTRLDIADYLGLAVETTRLQQARTRLNHLAPSAESGRAVASRFTARNRQWPTERVR